MTTLVEVGGWPGVIGRLMRGESLGAEAATSLTIRHNRRRKRAMPSTPSSVHSMSWSAGPMKRMKRRTASAPYISASWSGAATLPRDFDIFEPPRRTQPW